MVFSTAKGQLSFRCQLCPAATSFKRFSFQPIIIETLQLVELKSQSWASVGYFYFQLFMRLDDSALCVIMYETPFKANKGFPMMAADLVFLSIYVTKSY